MLLSEFRKIIDKLDDQARENKVSNAEIVLDISTASNDENKIDIGDIYKSRLSAGTVKIEPQKQVDAHRGARALIKDRDIVIKQTNYICPECGSKLGKHDSFCKFCGQQVYNAEDHKNRIA